MEKTGTWSECAHPGMRDYQQDRTVAEEIRVGDERLLVLGVMDGHGGMRTAEMAAKLLVPTFIELYQAKQPNMPAALELTFQAIDAKTKTQHTGSTLSVVVVSPGEQLAHVGILGDSPVIIRKRTGKLFTAPEHNARSNRAEREAAVGRGAVYTGGYLYDKRTKAGLQLSRSLGDYDCTFLDKRPEIFTVALNGESYILVGSDGLFDPNHYNSKEETARIAKLVEDGADAKALVDDALERQTRDNVSAIVWREV